jgi:sugar O-acyltransferase (sialic acid O-acetyltransferase NeuD family)
VADPIVIVGCGGHGREILGIIRAINDAFGEPWKVLGFVDDGPSDVNLARVDKLGVPYLGPTTWLASAAPGTYYVVGVGDPKVRAAIVERIDPYGLPAAVLIHPAATVGEDTEIAEGVVVFAGARVTTNVTLGRHVHLNQNCTVGHDTALEDFGSLHPLAAVSGDCRIAPAALVGSSAIVIQGLCVGARAVVGAGASVIRNVAPGATVTGVPARPRSSADTHPVD